MSRKNQSFSTYGIGMKWHKVLVFFLWFGAALNLLSGISYLIGGLYSDSLFDVYAIYPELRLFELVYGVAIIAFGIFQFFMRGRLKGLYKGAPKLLMANYVLLIVLNVAASVIPAVIAPEFVDLDYALLIGNVIGCFVGMAINIPYYKKRDIMFDN
jgi:hypothetical protein